MINHLLQLEPRDLLFLRDARPMEAADAGLGANLPRPDQIWNSLLNAFHREWPEHQAWEHIHTKKGTENENSSYRFGALQTAGPFPMRRAAKNRPATLYLPRPLDLSTDENDEKGRLHPMQVISGEGSDLPKPLTHAYRSACLGKQEPPDWISLEEYQKYLSGQAFDLEKKAELFDAERQVGIGIDPLSHSTREGAFYQAEYLRLRSDVGLAVMASCNILGSDRRATYDVLKQFLESGSPLVLGGQQGLVFPKTTDYIPLPQPGIDSSRLQSRPVYLRWTLLTPAVFPRIEKTQEVKEHSGGWLPNWIDPDNGQVMLPKARVDRMPGESREQWRMRVREAERFSCRLIAARIGKPTVFSGWDLRTGPKATSLAVPAGSVYLFRCAEGAEAEQLSQILSWNGNEGTLITNRRSTLFGEKGFGLGVCSLLPERESERIPKNK